MLGLLFSHHCAPSRRRHASRAGKGAAFLRPLPCPAGKGCCRCARSTLFALRAKALQSGAPDFLAYRKRKQAPKRFAHQATLPARRRTDRARFHAGNGVAHHPADGTRPLPPFLPHHPRAAKSAPGTSPRHRFSWRASGVCARATFPTKSRLFALPAAALFPCDPAGRTAGSARTRSRVQTLEDPIWGNGGQLSRLCVPQTAAGGKSLLVDLPPSDPSIAPFGTKRRTPTPCSWGGRSSTRRQRHWPSTPSTRT